VSEQSGAATLYVIATPIGNLEDVTYRAVRLLKELPAVACEDTRRTRILFERHGIPKPAVLLAYHEHNEERAAERILELLAAGTSVGLVSNAGYPAISDPGYVILSRAAASGHRVEVIPGGSAVPHALLLSCLPASSFTYKGFPPRKPGPLRRFLEMDAVLPHTLIFFESPHRLGALLEAAREVLGDRRAAVCIEMTKKFEQVRRGWLSELAREFGRDVVRGEVTVVVAGANPKFRREGAPEARAGETAE
jgi:16S rRNA (cytidine1402-2'-O)-methyltransferase